MKSIDKVSLILCWILGGICCYLVHITHMGYGYMVLVVSLCIFATWFLHWTNNSKKDE